MLFSVDHKSSKDLQQYLGHIAEQASIACDDLPAVIILDNLHHASALGDVFSCLLSAEPSKLPCIIGTMSQATCSTTNLQLHHNFRWVKNLIQFFLVSNFNLKFSFLGFNCKSYGTCKRFSWSFLTSSFV